MARAGPGQAAKESEGSGMNDTVRSWERSALTAMLVELHLNTAAYWMGWQQVLAIIPPKEAMVNV